MRAIRPVLFNLVLVLGLSTVASGDELAKSPLSIWREAPPAAGETELERLNRAFVQLANNARPAIVQIRASASQDAKLKSEVSQAQGSRGSGFIINSQGLILTAHHVIDKAKDIEVRLADGQRLPAQIITADAQVDLAIIRIPTERELPIVPLGDSEGIRVGDLAVVLGYPFGRESSMNLGI
ncbi:MAG: trypsin-like peptidase domain-containing protein, partial [Deltaproteobacteria bacterium]|nr:trypsin-like peptidase domain-containing protein [Deltaproteobacteria bacterium]